MSAKTLWFRYCASPIGVLVLWAVVSICNGDSSVGGNALPPIDPAHRDHFGEFYDPVRYAECRAKSDPADKRCEPYRLRRQEQREYWPYETKVPPPRWPEPPSHAKYVPGMSSKDYFLALCKAEAGEFIFRKAPAVEGILQIRPRIYEGDIRLADRYVIEDPFGYALAEPQYDAQRYVQPATGKYEFLEVPVLSPQGMSFKRYYRDVRAQPEKKYQTVVDGKWTSVPYIVAETTSATMRSKYGYTWRGIKRERDRALGIAGGELIVVELATNEVLGVRRGFVRSGNVRNSRSGIWWLSAEVCPNEPHLRQGDNLFIARVLEPGAKTQIGGLK